MRFPFNAVKDFGGASEDVKSDIHFKGMKVNAEGLITVDVAQEILWEISELYFYVELSTLDHYVSALPFDNHCSSILRCFASCPSNLYAVTFEEASAGLGALDIRHRAPYFQHLYSLMKDWKGHERAGPALSQDIVPMVNSGILRKEIWNLTPKYTDNIPGVLELCIGMPVMIKFNEATELCATNGQSWMDF